MLVLLGTGVSRLRLMGIRFKLIILGYKVASYSVFLFIFKVGHGLVGNNSCYLPIVYTLYHFFTTILRGHYDYRHLKGVKMW